MELIKSKRWSLESGISLFLLIVFISDDAQTGVCHLVAKTERKQNDNVTLAAPPLSLYIGLYIYIYIAQNSPVLIATIDVQIAQCYLVVGRQLTLMCVYAMNMNCLYIYMELRTGVIGLTCGLTNDYY